MSDSFAVQAFQEPAPEGMTIAEGYLNTDLNARYIPNPPATHLFAANSSAIEGIQKGDILIVDRSLIPRQGAVIIADLEGEYQVRRFIRTGSRPALVTDHAQDAPFYPDEASGFCCGVVTHAIHPV